MSKALTVESLTDRTRQVIEYYLAHPNTHYKEIGEALNISRQRVSQILGSEKVHALYPIFARKRIRSTVLPKALDRYEKIIASSPNDAVAEKAAGRVLMSEGAMGADASVNVNVKADITLRDARELQEIVKKAALNVENVVETEILDERPS